MTDREVESVAYPGPGSRPFRRDLDPIVPHVIVLFGCTGDLAKRKLLPGLAYLAESELAPAIRIVGTAMEDIDTEAFRALAKDAVQNYGMHRLKDEAWEDFAARLSYVPQSAGPEGLTSAVKEAQSQLGDDARLLHYLSVPPRAAQAVVEMLRDADLTSGARVIMEKPFGHDFESAVKLNDFVHTCLRRVAGLPHRPLPGQGGGAEHPRVPLRQRPVRADLEPQLHRPHPDRHPRGARARHAARTSTRPPARTRTWSSRTSCR